MSRPETKGLRALITGASNGIGLELARVFARNGWDLILVARSIDKLRALADQLTRSHGVAVQTIQKDLSVTESAEELFQETEYAGMRVDALVNNAGIGSYGFFARSDGRINDQLLQLNIVNLTHLTRLYLPPMMKQRNGWILNVASTAAFQPGPLMAIYYASKAYVLSFSEALSNELEGSGVSVTTLCPGATETGFRAAAGMTHSKLFMRQVQAAHKVAEEGYQAMMSRRTIMIPGFQNKIMASAVRLAPRSWVPKIVRKIQEPTL